LGFNINCLLGMRTHNIVQSRLKCAQHQLLQTPRRTRDRQPYHRFHIGVIYQKCAIIEKKSRGTAAVAESLPLCGEYMIENSANNLKSGLPLLQAIKALRQFQDNSETSLSSHDFETMKEIETRLLRLANQYVELLNINTRLMEIDPYRICNSFDPSSDTITFDVGDKSFHIKLRRANPNIPISLDGETIIGFYEPRIEPDESEEITKLKSRMEILLEGFYQSTHRILKLVSTLPGMAKVESHAITMVRNKLIEHPDIGDFYTFGWSTNGPMVRPLHRPGRKWVDSGLIPNTQEFTNILIKAFEKGVNNTQHRLPRMNT
jgi:hypothetical protein